MNPYQAYYQSVSKKPTDKRFEDLLLAQIAEASLPKPVREFKFHPDRRWRFDFAYLEIKLAIEVEGGTWSGGRHTRAYGFEGDCVKYNEALLAGWRVLRFTSKMVTDLRAIGFVKRALNA